MTLTTPPEGTILSDETYPHRLAHSGMAERLYVHPEGSDSYDGASWGRAKETILAAYDAISNRGEIHIAPGSQVGGEVSGQGIWIAGSTDPNYSSLPSGWRQEKTIKFIGASGTVNIGHHLKAHIVPGTGQSTWSGPWIALSYVGAVQFWDLANINNGNGYGIDMTRDSTGSLITAQYNCSGIKFKNINSRCTMANANNGYNPLRSFGSFWVRVEDCTFELGAGLGIANTLNGAQSARVYGTSEAWTMTTATPTDWPAAAPFTMLGFAVLGGERVRVTAKSGTSYTVTRGYDNTQSPAHSNGASWVIDPKDPTRAAVYLGDSSGNSPNYLWTMQNIVTYYGGIVTESQNVSKFENLAMESSPGSVIYFITPNSGNIVEMVEVYDQPYDGALGVVDVSPPNTDPSYVTISGGGVFYGRFEEAFGPCTLLDGHHKNIDTVNSPVNYNSSNISNGQRGFMDRRLYAQHDTSRRAGIAAAHHVNLCSQNWSDWTGTKYSGALADVFGLTNGGSGGSDSAAMVLYSGSWNPSAPAAGEWLKQGDFVFFGAWIATDISWHEATGSYTGIYPLVAKITAGAARFAAGPFVGATGDSEAPVPAPYRGLGDWNWFQGFAKVSTGGSSTLQLQQYFGSVVCYPVVFTTSAMRDAEAWEIFHHLQTYPNTAPAGSLSTFTGQKLIAKGGLGVGNSASATTPGSVTRKMEVFSETGASLGFVPIYGTIT